MQEDIIKQQINNANKFFILSFVLQIDTYYYNISSLLYTAKIQERNESECETGKENGLIVPEGRTWFLKSNLKL